MKPTLNEKLIAYLTLLSGLSVSAVAVYYSVAGLTAIFAAAVIPIVIMGVALEVGKLVATLWLKQNWKIAPGFVRVYLVIAITVLMAVTSMGIFGFLSKAHMDQSIPSGDVAAQVALFDEKIKTEKDNIDSNRKTLEQLDASVNQVLARSTTEEGASKSAALRKTQQKERNQLAANITKSQLTISTLQQERAPIASTLRKAEVEVGPIKYIAAFFYGETNPTVLEKAVTWVIILLIIVFDPLAVILLLASQYSFQSFRSQEYEVNSYTEPKVIFPTPPDRSPVSSEDYKTEDLPAVPDERIPLMPEIIQKPIIEKTVAPAVITEDDILNDPAWQAFFAGSGKDSQELDTTDETIEVEEQSLESDSIKEIQQDALSNVKYYDWSKIPADQEYVTIDGQKMHVRAAKALYKQTPSVYLDIIGKE